MTIQLPHDLESSLKAEVLRGQFADELDAVTAIVRDYFRRKVEGSTATHPSEAIVEHNDKPIWEVVEELRATVPPEEFLKLAKDGALQLDHYLHGSPKRPTG